MVKRWVFVKIELILFQTNFIRLSSFYLITAKIVSFVGTLIYFFLPPQFEKFIISDESW